MIRSYMRYWPVVGGVVFVALALTLGIFADSIPALQRLMVLFFMILSPILLFRDRNTRYGFADYDATHFSVKKGIARLRMD